MKIKRILLVAGLVVGVSIQVSAQNRKAVKAYETFNIMPVNIIQPLMNSNEPISKYPIKRKSWILPFI
jgi:hypothetical protein